MRGLIISLIIIAALGTGVCVNSFLVCRGLGELSDKIEAAEESEEAFEALYDDYMKKEKFLSMTVDDELLLEVENCFGDCIDSIKSKDETGVMTAKSRLLRNIEQIRRLSGFNIEAIL